jgi:hypothetical protein
LSLIAPFHLICKASASSSSTDNIRAIAQDLFAIYERLQNVGVSPYVSRLRAELIEAVRQEKDIHPAVLNELARDSNSNRDLIIALARTAGDVLENDEYGFEEPPSQENDDDSDDAGNADDAARTAGFELVPGTPPAEEAVGGAEEEENKEQDTAEELDTDDFVSDSDVEDAIWDHASTFAERQALRAVFREKGIAGLAQDVASFVKDLKKEKSEFLQEFEEIQSDEIELEADDEDETRRLMAADAIKQLDERIAYANRDRMAVDPVLFSPYYSLSMS